MKLAAICCTYKRPAELATVVECFLRQDYPDHMRELIVLDDAGQYALTALDGLPHVKLVVARHRFRTLGEKRNASAALASPDVEGYCVWDDDDIYLPWHMKAAAAALREADYTIPTSLWVENGGRLARKANQYLFHGAWSFRRRAFEQVCGYPFIQSGQDQGLLKRFKSRQLRRADPIRYDERPSYIYRWHTTHRHHISALGSDGYEQMGQMSVDRIEQIVPQWDVDWIKRIQRGAGEQT